MLIRRMLFQPIAAFFERDRLQLRSCDAGRDRGVVNFNDRRQVRFDRVADFHFFGRDYR